MGCHAVMRLMGGQGMGSPRRMMKEAASEHTWVPLLSLFWVSLLTLNLPSWAAEGGT